MLLPLRNFQGLKEFRAWNQGQRPNTYIFIILPCAIIDTLSFYLDSLGDLAENFSSKPKLP